MFPTKISIEKEKHDAQTEFEYMLLDRLKDDCNYFLNYGNRNPKVLWGITIEDHIEKMKELYNTLEIKPEWLTYDQILDFENQMKNG